MAAALYVLGQAAGRGGHCFLPAEELIQQTLKLVNASDEEEPVQAEEVEAALGELVQRWGEAIKEDEKWWLPYLYRAEVGVAKELARLSGDERPVMAGKLTEAVKKAEAALGISLLRLKNRPLDKQCNKELLLSPVALVQVNPLLSAV